MIRMASVDQALELILQHGEATLAATETLPAGKAESRVLATPVVAAVSQPPAAVSAMDGYAVRFSDMKVGHRLRIKGESSAGHPYSGAIDAGEAVRIFTGAHVPGTADHILIQEDAKREGDVVEVAAAQAAPGSIRRKGRDFSAGDELVPAGHRITAGAIALIAAGNVANVEVRVTPRVGVLANGDELVAPGSKLKPGEIVNSIAPALMSLIRQWAPSRSISAWRGTMKPTCASALRRGATSC